MRRFLIGTLLLFLAESAWGAISMDVTASKDQSSASSSITTQITTNSGNELLLALISADYLTGANTTITNVSGAGLTWQLVVRTNGQSGTAEIWRALAPTALSNTSVTASLSHSVLSSMTVIGFIGVDTSGINGAGAIGATASQHASSGAPGATLVTTRNNSWIFGVGNDYDEAITRKPAAGQALVHQFLTPTGDTYWTQMLSSPTPLSGAAVTLNDTSPTGDQYNLSICEILPAISSEPQTWSISGTLSPAAGGSGATVALSGASSATALADASGNYSFPGLSNGNYTITPTSAGYSFTPLNQTVTLNGADVSGVNFTGQPALQTWSISGTLSPASIGGGASLTLSGASSASVVADASGNYSFTGAANGNYTITPSKANGTFTPESQPVTVAGANVAGVNFTGQSNSVAGALAIDAKLSSDQPTASATIVSPTFSTNSGNELLVALIATDYLGGANTTVKAVTGAGLTWELVVRTNGQSGSSEIWRAFAPGALSGVSVTATLSQSVPSSMAVMSFTGADSSGTNGAGGIGATAGANASTGAPTASLVTTRNGSWVLGVGNDFDNATARNPVAGQSLVHQDLTPAGDTYWMQMQDAPTPLSGTIITISDTSPTRDRYNLSICEILPAVSSGSQTWTISGTLSPSTAGNGATVTLSGASSATVLAGANGNYSFPGLSNGNYAVTPTSAGYSFSPSNQPVTLNGADAGGVNFTAQSISQAWSISGTLNPVSIGGGATVTLSGPTAATVTADSSGNYSFTGVANGTYTVTPLKTGATFTPPSQPATVDGANVTGINFTGQSDSVPNALAMDAKVSKDQSTSSTSVVSPSFSTNSGNELLLAFIATDYLSGANTTVKAVAGAGLTWELVVRTNGQSGSSEIWRTFASGALDKVSVTATLSQSAPSSITVMSFAGADGSGVNGAGAIGATGSANASAGAPIASVVTTRNGSWVLGVGNDFDNAIARTPATGQTVVHQDLTPAGDTYWVQMQTAVTPLAGTSVSINDTAPTKDRFNLSVVEVMPALAGGGGATPPTVAMASPAPNVTVANKTTVSATVTSQNYPVLGVQFVLDGVNLGSEVTSAPYAITWDTSDVAAGQHTLAAVARNSAGLSATSNPITVSIDNSGNPLVVGSWSEPVSLPAVAVDLILLANNKLLFYQDGATPTLWDYVNNKFTNVATSADIFCSGHSMLADGRILIAGGYGEGPSTIGISSAEIFEPSNNTWTPLPNMAYRRWYPTATTLSDGKVLVTAGWQTTEHTNAGIPEIYDPSTNKWTSLNNANNPFETYPFIFQLSDGRVIHVGGSEYATATEALDLNSQTWSVVDGRIIDGGSATMYLPDKIMKTGSASDSQNSGPSSNTTFVLDMTQQSPAWKQTPSMAYPRSYLNVTTLPDGTVLATGGETDKNGGNIANAVYPAELWNPQTETWTTMASMHTPREYHSTALLLPDGRVLQSGMGADFGHVPNELSAEFFSPPYLFKGPRPVISEAPSQIRYGATFFVGTPDAASIAKAVLIRTGAVTHFFDQNTRFVPLTLQSASGGLTLTAPANGFDAPPGYYMLFLVNNSGVPAIAPFVQLVQ